MPFDRHSSVILSVYIQYISLYISFVAFPIARCVFVRTKTLDSQSKNSRLTLNYNWLTQKSPINKYFFFLLFDPWAKAAPKYFEIFRRR